MLGPAMPARRLAFALLLVASACAKKVGKDAAAPAGDAAAPDSIEALEAELGGYEAELRTIGLGKKAAQDAHVEAEGDDVAGEAQATTTHDEPCSRVCELAAAICGLQDRICGLAAEHDGEARYTSACERATEDCDDATEACDGCRG
jgi:hypothetical protein